MLKTIDLLVEVLFSLIRRMILTLTIQLDSLIMYKCQLIITPGWSASERIPNVKKHTGPTI